MRTPAAHQAANRRSKKYRKLAFETYGKMCSYCGFAIESVLQVAHIDQNSRNNDIRNLVVLCPTCHAMLDGKLIPAATILAMRRRSKVADWSGRMKDAGQKALTTRKKNAAKKRARYRKAGIKAAATRKHNQGR